MAKLSEADKKYLKWKAGDSHTVRLGRHEAALIIREDASVETYLKLEQAINEPELLALGLTWACENLEWKKKIARKARERLTTMLKEEGVAFTTPANTHED